MLRSEWKEVINHMACFLFCTTLAADLLLSMGAPGGGGCIMVRAECMPYRNAIDALHVA